MENESRQMVKHWYSEGRRAWDSGGEYDPPLFGIQMTAYAHGYEDALQCIWPEEEDVYRSVTRQPAIQ